MFTLDTRGGYNRKIIQKSFFKCWSPKMAYVLGLLFADGALLDVRKSSRTCYIQLTSKDKSLIEKVRSVMESTHSITEQKAQNIYFGGKRYFRSTLYGLRIGSVLMYFDLIKKGLRPRKSLVMKFPTVPINYLSFFIRGYFDGDGCVGVYTQKGRNVPEIQVVFTSGSKSFLVRLSKLLCEHIEISKKQINKYKNQRAYRLRYRKIESLKVLDFMYQDLDLAPYLKRKYDIYSNYKSFFSS